MFTEYFAVLVERLVQTVKSRVFWMGVICSVLLLLVVGKLYQLQILNGSEYYDKYVSKTKREISTTAVRGNICDRNGVVLAGNEVVYNLTIRDTGEYSTKTSEFNDMLMRLITILRRYGVEIAEECPVIINEHGEYEFSGTDSKIRQFITDIYTSETIEKEAKKGNDVYSYDTQTIMKRLLTLYGISSDMDMQDALDICNIRYAMSATSYSKYKATTIASDISDELAAAILEAQSEISGVEVEEGTKRVYPYAEYFSNILGYTGKPSSEELEELKETDSSYTANDLVGKTGLEKVYEEYLAGTKGTDTVYLNNVGRILETVDHVDSVNGDDIYLSLDCDLTVATYNLIEQRLAAIISEKLTEDDFTADASMLADEFYIPVKDAYFQMINNNILDISHFSAEDATPNERSIQESFESYRSLVLDELQDELEGTLSILRGEASEEFSDYYDFILSLLTSRDRLIFMTASIDSDDEIYTAWGNGTVSIHDYLMHAVEMGWIDSSKLDSESVFSSADEVYELLVEKIRKLLTEDEDFTKLLYQYMIDQERITGNQICMALMDQGILQMQEENYAALENGDLHTAFAFMKAKITDLEITPAQLALDPCSGSAVIVDEDTGELLALVSYPGYDLNKFSETVDPDYWKKVSEDQSSPLYNRATQVRTAPGSTFKMVTATAGLEEGVIDSEELITCLGTYDKLDHPMCWIAREIEGGTHGPLNTVGGLAMSCNFYFYEVGYRLSLNSDGEYDPNLGIERLTKYASLYGFGEKSGVEIEENLPTITTEYPVTSAIGQGTNNFTTISLARYCEAVATKGTLYSFLLLDKVYDTDGNLILDAGPTVERTLEFSENTWNVLHEGMYNVTHGDGSSAAVFTDSEIEIAGKSGSAQENKLRANHGMFVSFAPYNDPEIVVAVSIPNGYTAGNAGLVSKEIYRYYFGITSLYDILNRSYSSNSGSVTISD